MSNIKATVAANVLTNDPEVAREASRTLQSTLDRVWILEEGIYFRFGKVADGVYAIVQKVVAPEHELHAQAPIIREALLATGLAHDAVTVTL